MFSIAYRKDMISERGGVGLDQDTSIISVVYQ